VLVLSRSAVLEYLRTATVAPITSTKHGVPSEVSLGVEHGLKHDSVVNLDHIATVDQSDLRQFVGQIDEGRMNSICGAIAVALGCR
jgi:mRNA interferase MazF